MVNDFIGAGVAVGVIALLWLLYLGMERRRQRRRLREQERRSSFSAHWREALKTADDFPFTNTPHSKEASPVSAHVHLDTTGRPVHDAAVRRSLETSHLRSGDLRAGIEALFEPYMTMPLPADARARLQEMLRRAMS